MLKDEDMRIQDILRSKGERLATISPNASLLEASRAIAAEAVGSWS